MHQAYDYTQRTGFPLYPEVLAFKNIKGFVAPGVKKVSRDTTSAAMQRIVFFYFF